MANATIIGAGPIGICIAAELQAHGHKVLILGRNAAPLGPFSICNREGERRVVATDGAHAVHESDLAIVTVKAFDLLPAAKQHFGAFRAGIVVAILCNGNPEEEITEIRGTHPHLVVRQGVCLFGAFVRDDGEYVLASDSVRCVWGPTDAQMQTALEGALGTNAFAWAPEPAAVAREKWLFNVVANSLCAAFELPTNGQLMQMRDLVESAFAEAYQLGRVLWGNWRDSEAELRKQFFALVAQTRDNENSMRRDVRLGRRTESAWLAGRASAYPDFMLLNKLHDAIQRTNGG